ncbi:hypothetical protein [Pseudoduganella sp. OTU4001]|uniref:hypothetical protein n=1 Tax=Pseudoduganella sp. OTU4001 TaxID=3043854 RepID=UPI00313B7F42
MQNFEYLSHVQRMYLDSWRRCSDASLAWVRAVMDESKRLSEDILQLSSQTQVAQAPTGEEPAEQTEQPPQHGSEKRHHGHGKGGHEGASTMH